MVDRKEAGTTRSRAVLVALVVVSATVLSGCSGLPVVGGGGGEDWSVAGEEVPGSVQANLSTAPATVFQRVDDLLGVNGTSPQILEATGSTLGNASTPALRVLVGLPDNRDSLLHPGYVTYSPFGQPPSLQVAPQRLDELNDTELELELVAAYALGVHQQRGWNGSGPVTGATVLYTVSAYAEQYTNVTVPATFPGREGNAELNVRRYGQGGATPLEWVAAGVNAHYVSRAVAARLDSAADIPSFYEGGPPPVGESFTLAPSTLSTGRVLNLSTDNTWISPNEQPDRAYGELGAWALLATGIDNGTAAAAANGLVTDRVDGVRAVTNQTVGVAWAQRWENETEADEFASAMRSYLETRRSETSGLVFEFHRVAPEATVVVAGEPGTMNNTETGYGNGTVRVRVGL